MDSSDSDTGNLSTSPTTAARFGAARNRYLLAMQVKMLRGLKSRWQKLSASYAVDSIELSRKSEELQSEFSSRFATQTTQHREELSNLVTNWDEIGRAHV